MADTLADGSDDADVADDIEHRLLTDGGIDDGLVTLESDGSVDESVARVKDAIDENDALGLMAEVDHTANAETVDCDLPPTIVQAVLRTRYQVRRSKRGTRPRYFIRGM